MGWQSTLAVARGGTGTGTAGIGAFNNITGLSAAGTTGTTSTNLVFSTSPTLVTPVLGAATATSINGLTITSSTGTLTITNGKTLSVSDTTTIGTNSITFAGGEVVTFTATNALTFTTTGSTNVTLPTTGTLVSSVTTGNGVSATNTAGALAFTLGAITPTTVNGLTITSTTGTLTITNGKTISVAKTLTLDGTDGTTMTFPSTSATIARTDAANTFTGASTASAWILTSPTITTKISPTSDDGAPIGDTTHNFSDLFLASGALINFANSNAVITHSSGVIGVTTGDLRVTSANVGTNADSVPTLSSTSTLTNKTLTSPTLTTPSAFTTGGTITLAENTSIALDPAGSADGKYTGITVTATAGYTQAFGDLVYLDPTDSRWEATDANSAAGADGDARGILGMVVVAGTDGNACTILLNGIIRADAKFPTFTVNNPIYVSETAGAVTQTQPTTTDVVIRIVGAALTTDEMYFNPDWAWITHT